MYAKMRRTWTSSLKMGSESRTKRPQTYTKVKEVHDVPSNVKWTVDTTGIRSIEMQRFRFSISQSSLYNALVVFSVVSHDIQDKIQ
jgi:hypothetical protein